MFFKTLFIALAMIIFALGVLLVEAVLRDRPYTGRLLLGTAAIYAMGGVTALIFSLAKL